MSKLRRRVCRGGRRTYAAALCACLILVLAATGAFSSEECVRGTLDVSSLKGALNASAAPDARGAALRWAAFSACLAMGRVCSGTPPSAPLPFARLDAHYRDLLEASRAFRDRTPHCYAGYGGPWIENAWISAFAGHGLEAFYPLVPLFLQITDICVSGDAHAMRALVAFFASLRTDVLYVIVVQHDDGLCFLPDDALCSARNVLILSAGGWGHVALPLLKGAAPSPMPPLALTPGGGRVASYLLGFAGSLDTHRGGFRRHAVAALRRAGSMTREDQLLTFRGAAWRSVMSETALPLAPRGYGRSSFRTSELVQLGLPQLVIWSDVPWLPYYDPVRPQRRGRTTVWGEGGIGLHSDIAGLATLVPRLCAMTLPAGLNASALESACPPHALPRGPPYTLAPSSLLARMGARAEELSSSHFSHGGVMDRIREFLATPWDADLVCVPLPSSRV